MNLKQTYLISPPLVDLQQPNKLANSELSVQFENTTLKHNKNPKYLGVTLDRTLSFKEHLSKTADELKTRNIILNLCGTSWGASNSTLRSSALGLVYSDAEYCAPVWLNSPHFHKIDAQTNNTMRMIAGVIKSTPTQWLPVLSLCTESLTRYWTTENCRSIQTSRMLTTTASDLENHPPRPH
ncbi:uncharacterized protein LOC115884649 [Sitophilus oryzae]|uniref:Uncharacterized protein LOC115884649 n=1 Tax=Sitophilus oryzae TaxID=7048 RepID=A0A6J2Y869_SITOR|nr:uncharacterized protein LOC115884649 [Sitophilus oryzae]